MKRPDPAEIIWDVEKIERNLCMWQSTGNKSYLLKAIDLTHDLLFVLKGADANPSKQPESLERKGEK